MAQTKRVTTRELLRNFKSLKEELLQGRVLHLLIDVGSNQELDLSLRKRANSGSSLAEQIRHFSRPVSVKRSDVFEGLFG